MSAIIRPEGPPGQIIERYLRASTFDLVMSPAIRDEVLGALASPKVRKSVKRDADPDLWFEDIIRVDIGATSVHVADDDQTCGRRGSNRHAVHPR